MGIEAALIGGGLGLLGSAMSSRSAKKAANTQAQSQREAAQLAAEESRFRPVAITTGFGRSNFETGPDGRVTGASYQLTPEMLALQQQILGQTGQGMGFAQQGLGAAEGMFGLGRQYLAQSPEQAAQQWMASQQAALAPGRQQALGGLMNKLVQTGTQGLGVAQAGGGQANPLAQAFANAQAQQDLELAARAQEQGRAQTQFGTGLFADALRLASGSYSPLNAQLQQAQGIESLGQSALDIGAQLGGRVANATGAQALLSGGNAAAQSLGAVQGYNPFGSTLQGLGSNANFGNAVADYFNPKPQTGANITYAPGYEPQSANSMFQSWTKQQ